MNNEIEKLTDRCARYAEEIAVLQEKTRWIPVTERLPEENEPYIVSCDDSMCPHDEGIWYARGVVVVAEYYNGAWTWDENGTEYSLENIVTHWMPLPAGPEVE